MAKKTMLIAVWVAAGCGGDGSSREVSISQAVTELTAISCRRAFECCDAAEIEAQYGLLGIESEDECVETLGAFSAALLTPSVERGVDSGRLIYRGGAMGDCLAEMEAMSCEEMAQAQAGMFPQRIDCDDPFEGQVADGGTCASDLECESSYCNGDSLDFEGNLTREGTCEQRPVEGEACPESDCEAGAYCAPDTQSGERVCHAAQPAGADCVSDDACDSANCVDGTCAADLQCDGQ